MKNSLPCLLALAAALAGAGAAAADPAAGDLPNPLDLRGAVLYALDHNYPILQAREQIRQQEGIVLQARAPGIPNVKATGSYERNSASVSETYPPETSEWIGELEATQTLYAGGGIRSSIRNAELTRDSAMLDLQAAVNTALLDVRTKFYTVLLDREQVKVQEENVALYERELRDARNQFAAGAVSNFEVLRAEVSLANAQPDLITARNNYRITIEQLRQSLGVPPAPAGAPPPAFPEVVGDLSFTPETYDLDSALESAHAHRPELLSLGKLEDAGEQSVKNARSNYYPNVSLFGGYEIGGISLATTGNNYTANGWMAGVQSTWSIFDGRATAGKVRQARSGLEQARLTYAAEELSVDVEVRQALSSLEEATELANASKKTVDQAAEALREADSRYKAGTATQLDVLTSQVSLTQARTNQLEANYNYLVAVASVRKAIGLGDALVGD